MKINLPLTNEEVSNLLNDGKKNKDWLYEYFLKTNYWFRKRKILRQLKEKFFKKQSLHQYSANMIRRLTLNL